VLPINYHWQFLSIYGTVVHTCLLPQLVVHRNCVAIWHTHAHNAHLRSVVLMRYSAFENSSATSRCAGVASVFHHTDNPPLINAGQTKKRARSLSTTPGACLSIYMVTHCTHVPPKHRVICMHGGGYPAFHVASGAILSLALPGNIILALRSNKAVHENTPGLTYVAVT
jgi:hypothetical protein